MSRQTTRALRTVGVLAAWQVYAGTTVDGYLHALFDGILAAAQDHRCNLLLGCGVASPMPRRAFLPAWPVPMHDTRFVPIGPWNTDGLIIVPNGLTDERLDYIRSLQADGHPVVFAGAPEPPPAVAVDNARGIDEAVEHLQAHGHQRIACIAGPIRQPGDSLERLHAFQAALERFGLVADPRLIAYADQPDDVESGRQAMQKILALRVPFSGLIAYNDLVAIGAMQTLQSTGLGTPHDVAVIGFDDRLHARVQTPPLTTVRHPTFDLGYQSLVALLSLISGLWDGKIAIRIPMRLVIRQSCGCRPGVSSIPTRHQVRDPDGRPQRSITATAMANAAAAEAQHYHLDDLYALSDRLLAAFMMSTEQANTGLFNETLANTLQQAVAREEEVYIWHAAISALEHSLRAADGLVQDQMDRLLNQAHLTISEQSRRQITDILIHRMETSERFGLMTAHLLAALDMDQIAGILSQQLPAVGIRHMQAALFMEEEDDPVAVSKTIFRCGLPEASTPDPFITRHFPISGSYPPDEPFRLAVLPFLIQEQNVGFVAFDASNLEPCALIMRNLASAWQSSRLYHDAAEGRRLAEEANRLKTRFLSTVSHELRTPLNVIVGLSNLVLNDQARGAQPAIQDLERIYASAQHLGFLIRDVLDLASSDAGQLRLSREPLDLVQVMQPVVVTGEQLARDKALTWCVHIPASTPYVWGDRIRLRQVALNFISNAAKFTREGTITFAIETGPTQVIVSVTDTGLGIPVAEHQSIFDEFHQSERTASRGYGGLGLGLAISRHLIEMHGGTVGVRSSGVEGEGATFYFSLPLLAQPPDTEPRSTSAAPADTRTEQPDPIRTYLEEQGLAAAPPIDRTRTILIVEDNPNILDLHGRLLKEQIPDCRVLQARDGRQALSLLEQARPDLILLDLMMPELDGFGVLEALQSRESRRDIPVIVLTARALNEVEMTRLNRGVVAVLEKGILSVEETVARVADALRHSDRTGSTARRLVRMAMLYVHEHYGEPITREQLAHYVGASESYLANCFHQELGISPMAYLNRCRIRQARSLLEAGELSITEVAFSTGFSDSAYFSRVFQREVGVPPGAYRRGQRMP